MNKRKNPAAVALGRKGGAKRAFHPKRQELARMAAIKRHFQAGHKVSSENVQLLEKCPKTLQTDEQELLSDENVLEGSEMSPEIGQ